MSINTTEQMRAELSQRIKAAGLEGQCLCDGAFQATVAIIAEAPGEREVETGRPLVGGSGSKLWEVLRGFKVNRTDVYITNVSKRQVSLGNDKRHPINRHELESWYSLLQWELEQLPNLQYVLILGNLALQALLGRNGITDWRGSVIDHELPNGRKIRFVCTYNPAMVLRDPLTEIAFKLDCSKLRKVMDGNYNIIPVISHINPTFGEAMSYLDHVQGEQEPIAYDTEIISNETACIGFANNPNEGMCISWRNRSDAMYTVPEERELRRRIQRLVADPDVRLIPQNGMFDASWLAYKDRIVVKRHWLDTMLAHHTLYPLLPHNLGFITTQYTNRPFYKNEKSDWKDGDETPDPETGYAGIDRFWHYNVQDCCNTWSAAFSMLGELKQQKLDTFFFDHVMRVQPHLVRMTVGGVLIDTELKSGMVSSLQDDLHTLLKDFHQAVADATGEDDYKPNPRSVKDMSELLFNKLRLVGRGASTNKENRDNMYAHPATTEPKRKVLRALNEYATEQKFFSTYATSGIDEDDRMRCTYNQTGVQSAPGRLSSSGMLWGHWENGEFIHHGMNLQNQPDRAHAMFIADPGYGFGYFDMSQAEARVVGWIANIIKWIDQFERARIDGGYDAHRALASEMFGVPYDEVPTYDRYSTADGHPPPPGIGEFTPTIRYIAKRCRHGLNYRMGPERLSATTGLDLAAATTAYRIYHRQTPELQQWWKDVEQEVREHGTLFNAMGRRWLLMQRMGPEALESIVAFKPQSFVGDWLQRVIYMAEDDPRWPSTARMALNIHDALVVLAPLPKVELCLSIALKYAGEEVQMPYKNKGMIKHRGLIIPSDAKISVPNDRGFHSWGSLKKASVEAAA
ncbi:MAG: hypothetical protein KKH61_21300 [Gammaproteobacteria bacterium]|uniref:Putative DNA polymerase n=2 Tax=viral metagenome TaxID=1070528 RepID=A0A6H1Z9S1_9ZZZZ|nr:hypothetical protein [Gammaproteobacteria bacterium]